MSGTNTQPLPKKMAAFSVSFGFPYQASAQMFATMASMVVSIDRPSVDLTVANNVRTMSWNPITITFNDDVTNASATSIWGQINYQATNPAAPFALKITEFDNNGVAVGSWGLAGCAFTHVSGTGYNSAAVLAPSEITATVSYTSAQWMPLI